MENETNTQETKAPSNENQEEKTVSKELFDKQAQELASYKKQIRNYMSAEAKAQLEAQEKDTEINELRAFKKSAELSSGLVQNLGAENSQNISAAIISGETKDIVKAINEAFTTLLKAKNDEIANLKLEAMNQGSNGSNNGTNKTITVDDFKAMGIDQRIALKKENPQLYEKLRRG